MPNAFALLQDDSDNDEPPQPQHKFKTAKTRPPQKAVPKLAAPPTSASGWEIVKSERKVSAPVQVQEELASLHLQPLYASGCHLSVVDRSVVVRLFKTDIVVLTSSGDVRFTSGGWVTHRTYEGVQEALAVLAPNLSLSAGSRGRVAEGDWHVCVKGGDKRVFKDGMVLPKVVEDAPILVARVERELHRPSDGSVCKASKKPGHWLQHCPSNYTQRVVPQKAEPAQHSPETRGGAAKRADEGEADGTRSELVQRLHDMSGFDLGSCMLALRECAADVNVRGMLIPTQPPAGPRWPHNEFDHGRVWQWCSYP